MAAFMAARVCCSCVSFSARFLRRGGLRLAAAFGGLRVPPDFVAATAAGKDALSTAAPLPPPRVPRHGWLEAALAPHAPAAEGASLRASGPGCCRRVLGASCSARRLCRSCTRCADLREDGSERQKCALLAAHGCLVLYNKRPRRYLCDNEQAVLGMLCEYTVQNWCVASSE